MPHVEAFPLVAIPLPVRDQRILPVQSTGHGHSVLGMPRQEVMPQFPVIHTRQVVDHVPGDRFLFLPRCKRACERALAHREPCLLQALSIAIQAFPYIERLEAGLGDKHRQALLLHMPEPDLLFGVGLPCQQVVLHDIALQVRDRMLQCCLVDGLLTRPLLPC